MKTFFPVIQKMKEFTTNKLHYRYVKASPSGRRKIILDINLDRHKKLKINKNGSYKDK